MTVLIIESNLIYAHQIKEKISSCQKQIEILHASSLQEALALLHKRKIDLIITNLFLRDAEGPDIITKLTESLIHIPILLCGEKIHESVAEQAIHLGAQDLFDIKKTSKEQLLRLMRYARERQYLVETLRALSFTDELTGIYNRRGFVTLAEQQMELSIRTNRGFCFYLMDIDYFKSVNDHYGHQIGDKAIKEVATLIKQSFRRYDIVGRMGGDEFAALAIDLAPAMKDSLKEKVKKQVHTHTKTPYTLSISVGSAYYDPKSNLSFEELFRLADENLYQEKEARTLIVNTDETPADHEKAHVTNEPKHRAITPEASDPHLPEK